MGNVNREWMGRNCNAKSQRRRDAEQLNQELMNSGTGILTANGREWTRMGNDWRETVFTRRGGVVELVLSVQIGVYPWLNF